MNRQSKMENKKRESLKVRKLMVPDNDCDWIEESDLSLINNIQT